MQRRSEPDGRPEAGRLAPVVVVDGDVDPSAAIDLDVLLRAAAPDQDTPLLVVDLSGVTALSSAGLDALLAAQQRLEARGGRLELRDPSAEVVLLLQDALDEDPSATALWRTRTG